MKKEFYEMLEIGCLTFMFIYQLLLFFQIRKKQYLYLALSCLTMLIRSMLIENGSQLMLQLFPSMGFELAKKIEFLVTFANVILIPMFVHSIFYFKSFNKYIRVFQIVGSISLLFILFTSSSIYFKVYLFFQGTLILSFFLVFRILYKAHRRGRTGALSILCGLGLCFVFVVLEIFRVTYIIDLHFSGPNLINTGMVIFLFFLSYALSSIFAESFKENVELNNELNNRVLDRTKALSESNLVKERIIRIISHDLRAPMANLNGLVTIAQLNSLPKEELDKNFIKINKGIGNTLNMLDDLLAWATTSETGDGLKLYFEQVDLPRLVDSQISKFGDIASEKGIKIINEIKKSPDVRSDQNVLKVVIRNLITNAIKFTNKMGEIRIRCRNKAEVVEIEIVDNGIGLTNEMKSTIFDMNIENNRPGTENEKSSGVGLALVKDLVNQNEGTISVEDNPKGQGVIFKFDVRKWQS